MLDLEVNCLGGHDTLKSRRRLSISIAGLLLGACGYIAAAVGAESDVQLRGRTLEQEDRLYQETLKTAEALRAVWNQQVCNVAALDRYLHSLRENLRALSESPGATSAQPPSPERTVEAERATVTGPTGPVEPSATTSSREEIESREKATLETHRPTPPSQRKPRSLASVAPERVRMQLQLAERNLKELSELLANRDFDAKAFAIRLEELIAILNGL